MHQGDRPMRYLRTCKTQGSPTRSYTLTFHRSDARNLLKEQERASSFNGSTENEDGIAYRDYLIGRVSLEKQKIGLEFV